ncbi:hypothetical protein F0P96_15780 [Hymenobacter busanensis]|uniref:Uncharacterized protein n=1 Tax=Hymenobacter busanensis TaxID=2607656 RepID=A0A7L4ZXQ1_9BACT|nr:hypothetical protein [Hymenobacter busanensis]KAA9327443.1 hypothetical protein F0P96_15780 [Hymenobacter busanensis]QHJ06220.1 hypothetical protein GUY19_02460 [Hymenobacter busanensis]
MFRTLLLVCALLILGGSTPTLAARPSAYAKAKMKGRMFTHRPVYKSYKSVSRHRRSRVGKLIHPRIAPRTARF